MDYGRNFGFRISPTPEQRKGRYINGATRIPIGAPVVAGAVNADGRNAVALASGVITPKQGIHGLVIFEHAWAWDAGQDPFLALSSDMDYVPAAAPCQLVSGTEVKVWLANTADEEFLVEGNDLEGKTYVAPSNLAGLAVGTGLRPHATPSDTNGYWEAVAGAEVPWLTVTNVEADRGLVEAQMAF